MSGMFDDSWDGSPMSAHLAKWYDSPSEATVGDNLMVALTVGFVRGLGLGVATQPPTDDPGHVWVFGKKKPAIKRKLAKHARWVISPKDTDE